ncbi:MAG TPA: hypothetical protein VIO95_00085 [Mycobacterium sp.]
MFTLLWFSLGWLAWGALVTVINVVTTLVTIAFVLYASLAVLGALIVGGISLRRARARRRRPDITPPIVVADGPECRFYRSSAAAVTSGLTPHTKVFDAQGLRLVAEAGALYVSPANPDGAEELAGILRGWLGYMDAIRWSVADMELPLLLQASTEHLGYSD